MPSQLDRCLAAIARAVPDDRVIVDRDVRAAYARDESGHEGALPDAVVRAESAREVALVLREAAAYRVPVTPRGGGSGKAGGAIPIRGGIVLATERMRTIDEIDAAAGLAVVGAGVVTRALHDAVEQQGLFWGPDPNGAEQSTIGGNVATNAAGPRTLKYGATRDWVLGLEVVTAAGDILSLGRRTKKGVVGYDLTSLLVGSEGTLAVVTRATLRLLRAPEKVVTILAFVRDHAAIVPAMQAVRDAGIAPRCLELFDAHTLALLRGRSPVPVPEAAGALLAIELDGSERAVEHDLGRLGEALARVSPFEPLVAQSPSERERFWRLRRETSRALRASARFKLSEDVVVPPSRLAELLAACEAIAKAHGIRMPAYGHAGDGNLHVNLLWDEPERAADARRAARALFEATVSLGGSLSGEHGIGLLKAPYLALEQRPELIALQRRLAAVFDPAGILNPGKIFVSGHGDC